MAQNAVIERLEAVAARLESVASRLGRGGGGGDDGDDAPPYVADFENFVATEVAAAAKASDAAGVPDVGPLLLQGFNSVLEAVRASATCKKPSPQDLLAFLKPAVDAINEGDKLKFKGKNFKKYGDHYKAFYEMIMSISWVTMSPPNGLPYQHVEAQEGATDFNLNRILKNCKDDESKAFVRTFKAVNKRQKELVGENFKRDGLTWNPKGGDLSSYTKGGGGAKAAPKKEAPKKNAAEQKEGGGMEGVFGQLNKGLNVTGGLKKVTADMKTKNRKDKSGKVEQKEPVKKAPAKKKPPASTTLKGGRWMIENYNEEVQILEKGEIKHNVYISNCDGTTVQIKNKVKAVTVDSCTKARIFINEVVSQVELVNCKSVTLFVENKVPTISVEKCSSPRIVLMKEAYKNPPDLYTSNISAMNVEIPGKSEKDDNIEVPIPEQFVTKIDPKTNAFKTSEVSHG